MHNVFIDGQAGTTGLQIHDRLKNLHGIRILTIDEALRKDESARREIMNRSDVVFLCLPDAAAVEAVNLIENENTIVIDASTAHRTHPNWVYGLAELSEKHRAAIKTAKRIANPGCYATGFLAAVYPLIANGLIAPDYPFTCHGLSGYSGAGKAVIAQYESPDRPASFDSPRQYGLSLHHKHLPEMKAVAGLTNAPLFNPIICDFYCGMVVSVPVWVDQMKTPCTVDQLIEVFKQHYKGNCLIEVLPAMEDGFLPANQMANQSGLKLYVQGNDEQMTLVSVFDNLGKGASGAAIQNMNLALGLDEYQGL